MPGGLQGRDGKAAAASLKAACLEAVENSKVRGWSRARLQTTRAAALVLALQFAARRAPAAAGSEIPAAPLRRRPPRPQDVAANAADGRRVIGAAHKFPSAKAAQEAKIAAAKAKREAAAAAAKGK